MKIKQQKFIMSFEKTPEEVEKELSELKKEVKELKEKNRRDELKKYTDSYFKC